MAKETMTHIPADQAEEQKNRDAGVQNEHPPRPVRPEDDSYGELMLRFTANPVKPKYWFEEFGDHWTCSCGQINKGESCSNCGLERDLLRKLFILHKPSPDGTAPEPEDDETVDLSKAATAAAKAGLSASPPQPETPSASEEDAEEDEESASSHKGLVIGIVIIVFCLLLGTGAFLYFVLLPEMQEQDAAKRDSVRISLAENLPVATAPIPKAQYKAYVSAGDMLCGKGKYIRAMDYYNKAADLKDDDSIRQKILDAKFGYVKAHRAEADGYFETYLNELVEARYDGARAIYDQYYAWNVTIIANNLKDDFSTDMENLNRADTVYFHTTVTGGAPNDELHLYYKITWPDSTTETKNVESSWSAGSHFTSRFQYSMPLFAKTGKLIFELYDRDSHDLLGKDTVTLKK